MKKINILGFNIFTDDLNKIDFLGKTVINTINPHSYYNTKHDSKFKSSLTNCDYLVPDGIGFVIAAFFLKKKN